MPYTTLRWSFVAAISLVFIFDGPVLAQVQRERVLHFDFPAIHIGTAEYDEGPTGTTVFYFPDGVIAAADVRGGSPGTINVPAVRLGYEIPYVDAVVFSGGSSYGLSAATGVANEIRALKREEGEDHIATVLGAIIYDIGGRRFSRITPDDALGATALRSAEPNRFPLGPAGAGRLAMQGAWFQRGRNADGWANWARSGQGGAFVQVGPTKLAVFTVVNSMGVVVDRGGSVVRCHRNDPTVDCPAISDLLARTIAERTDVDQSSGGPTFNTTLTLVVTNQKMAFADLQRLAVQVHSSMARAIQPFSTESDGDVLYAVTTSEVENETLSLINLATLASELAWDAVLSSVPELPTLPVASTERPAADLLRQYLGNYELPDGSRLTVTLEEESLFATFSKGPIQRNVYFADGQSYELVPAGDGLFIIDGAARDTVRFDVQAGEVSGLTFNPGPWAMAARRTR